jgi:hypothetical protein
MILGHSLLVFGRFGLAFGKSSWFLMVCCFFLQFKPCCSALKKSPLNVLEKIWYPTLAHKHTIDNLSFVHVGFLFYFILFIHCAVNDVCGSSGW